MSRELVVDKKLLKVEKVIDERTVRETIEAEIELPFKVQKVFDVIANVIDVEEEVEEGGVKIEGVIDKQLFVVDKGDLVRHIPEEIPFSVFVDIAGAEPDMNAQVRIRILSVDTELEKADKILQTIILEIFVKVTVTKQIEVVVDVKGRDIKVKKELLKVDSVVGEDTISQALTRTVTLPITAKKIFRILPTVRDVTAEVEDDTVIIKGVIHKQIFLVDEGDLVRHASEDIPFTKTVDIPGARRGHEVQVHVKVTVDDFEVLDAPSKELRQVIIIEAFVKVTETLQIEVVTDVKGPGIEVERKLLKVDSVVVDVLQKETVKATIKLPVQAKKIFEILAEIVDLEAEARQDQVIVKGVLHKQIFFVDPGDLVRHEREDVPFRFVKKAPGAREGMNVQVRARIVGDIKHRLIDEKKVEQTAVIEIFAKVTKTVQLEVVVDVVRVSPEPPRPPKPEPPKPPKPPVKTYIVRKGDTLFEIAKRFGVSLDDLIAANPQIKDPDLIFPGQEIFIPKGKPMPPDKKVYIVQPGDTMFLIAKKFGVTLDELIRANPQIADPNRIFPGDCIFIP